MKLIMVRCVFELTVRQNQYFFYQFRCYLLLFEELRMNNPKHNQFHTCLIIRVDFIPIPKWCGSFNHSLLTVGVAEWSKAPGWTGWGVGSIPRVDIYNLIFNFSFAFRSSQLNESNTNGSGAHSKYWKICQRYIFCQVSFKSLCYTHSKKRS